MGRDERSDLTPPAASQRKTWETPTFDRHDVRSETKSKYATTTEYTSTTGPTS